jgi:hypothetical protein
VFLVSTRIKILCLGCAVATVLLAGFAAPKDQVRDVSAAFVVAPDSTVTATATVAIKGKFQPGDQLRYKFAKDGSVLLNTVQPGLTYTATGLTAPGYGETACYTVGARIVYANGTQTAEKSSAPWCYTRPALPEPPAEIDSVTITPASATVGLGKTQRFVAAVFAR